MKQLVTFFFAPCTDAVICDVMLDHRCGTVFFNEKSQFKMSYIIQYSGFS